MRSTRTAWFLVIALLGPASAAAASAATAGSPAVAAVPTPLTPARSVDALDVRPRSETVVAVSPRDPKQVAVLAIQHGRPFLNALREGPLLAWDATWRSPDGGQSYGRGGLLPHVQPATPAANDPSLSWGPHALYASYTTFVQEGPRSEREGLYVARSVDGGRSWRRATHIEGFHCSGPDRSTVAADPRRDTVFVTWVHYDEGPGCGGSPDAARTELRWARSTDGGRTFGKPVVLTRGGVSNRIAGAVLPDGTFVTTHPETGGVNADDASCQFPTRVVATRWRGDGSRLGAATALVVCANAGGLSPNGSTHIPISFPSIAADDRTGALVVVMPSVDALPGVGTAVSRDGGRTWSSSVVRGLPGSSASMASVAAAGGRAALAWLEVDAGGLYRALLSGSTDDGRTWSEPLALSEAPVPIGARSVPVVDRYGLGHYMGVALATDGVAHVAWPQLLSRPDAVADPDVFVRSARVG
jgi:hypothetical protein